MHSHAHSHAYTHTHTQTGKSNNVFVCNIRLFTLTPTPPLQFSPALYFSNIPMGRK